MRWVLKLVGFPELGEWENAVFKIILFPNNWIKILNIKHKSMPIFMPQVLLICEPDLRH